MHISHIAELQFSKILHECFVLEIEDTFFIPEDMLVFQPIFIFFFFKID